MQDWPETFMKIHKALDLGLQAWRTTTVGASFFDAIDGLTRIQHRMSRFETALQRCCDETDYCYSCDNHPSHGHAPTCVFAE